MLTAKHWIYTETEVRNLERAYAARANEDLYALMTAAARAAFRFLRVHWSIAKRVTVVVGSGNNGGDGLVLAGLLRAAGYVVSVVATSAGSKATEALRARQEWLDAGGEIIPFHPGFPAPDADLLVDAVFGIGLTQAPEGLSAAAIRWINQAGLPVLSLDLPSGVVGDTGHCPGDVVRATRTLCFMVAKPGLLVGDALNHVGQLQVDDLGVPVPASRFRVLVDGDLDLWRQPRPRVSHKGDYGRALILAGAPGMHGAALLSAAAALRTAPGYVWLVTTEAAEAASLIRHPEVMTSTDSTQRAAWLARASAVLVGPGIGQGDAGRSHFAAWSQVQSQRPLPSVLDADALNLLAQQPHSLSASVILTPHPAEAARLLSTSTERVQQDRVSAARNLAERYGAISILKGAGTVLAHPDGRLAVCTAGNPGMAIAGMGDVLSGLLVGLMAQHDDPWQCACTAVLVHAQSGDWLAAQKGIRSVQPSALLDVLGDPVVRS